MKNKTAVAIFLSVLAVVGGMILNFQEFLMGSSATAKNLIVTSGYIVIWILVLGIGTKNKNRGIIKYCSVFWAVTLFISIVTAYVNATGAAADWALPLVVLLLGQLYGVNFFVDSFTTAAVILSVLSLIMFTAAVISLKGMKHS